MMISDITKKAVLALFVQKMSSFAKGIPLAEFTVLTLQGHSKCDIYDSIVALDKEKTLELRGKAIFAGEHFPWQQIVNNSQKI